MNIKNIVKDVMAKDEARSQQQPQMAQIQPQQPMNYQNYQQQVSPVNAFDSIPPVTNGDEDLRRVLASIKTVIKVFGCGGAGSNTVARIVEEGIYGADLYALNTDAQHLLHIQAPHKILLGKRSTRGLGAGSVPQIGEESALESEDEIRRAMSHTDIAFVTCGLGGGTGTGSSSVVARIAKEMGALTIAIVTQPFSAEGVVRMQNAEYGLERLVAVADTVVVIPNDKLLKLVPRLPLNAAFKVADEILMRAIKGITEIITKVGLVNLDYNDLKTVMGGGGVAMIGIGEADADNRAEEAVKEALNSPLLDVDIGTATGALVNVTGGEDMSVRDAESVAEIIQSRISEGSRIIWGAMVDPTLEHTIQVLIVLTGVKSKQILGKSATQKVGSRLGIDFVR